MPRPSTVTVKALGPSGPASPYAYTDVPVPFSKYSRAIGGLTSEAEVETSARGGRPADGLVVEPLK